eukprot:CAMPEP_0168496154 /NCGR_PEP_ID=MMETSP0228-20121227/72112_1 /TAXON_ID=133427 /ORGANISM="Protoceratium reticulatum, Strain CCCM 535 (=CCMP 1889)" /LENGTH=112 /DNA_ID=CAMNT_0008513007 /DNA_START=55 /DNA_END=390 /DNA_ORIENTATION=-
MGRVLFHEDANGHDQALRRAHHEDARDHRERAHGLRHLAVGYRPQRGHGVEAAEAHEDVRPQHPVALMLRTPTPSGAQREVMSSADLAVRSRKAREHPEAEAKDVPRPVVEV